MKLHLPLSLRSALLLACALLATASAEVLTADFTFLGGKGLVHSGVSEVQYDGNGRQFSYTATPGGDGVFWMQANRAKLTMVDMKDITVRNLHGVVGQMKASYGNYYYLAPTDIDITNSRSFTFEQNHADELSIEIKYIDPYYRDNRTHKEMLSSASLSSGGDVRLTHVDEVIIRGNEGAVMRGGSLSIENADKVVFSNHTQSIFDKNPGILVNPGPMAVTFSKTNSSTTKATFKDIKSLIFSDNGAAIFSDAANAPEFINCDSVLFENSVSIGTSAKFEDCASVVFINTSLDSSTFTGSDTIEIKGREADNVGKNARFEDIGKGVYITGNKSMFSNGFTATGREDKQAELIITGNTGDVGTWSAASLRKVELSNNSMESSIALISSVANVGALTIADNTLTATAEARDIIKISKAKDVKSIVISGNKVHAPSHKSDTGIISITEGTDIDSLEITGNVVGCSLANGKYQAEELSGTFRDMFGKSAVSGRTENGLSSTVLIADNTVGVSGSRHGGVFSLSNLLSLEVKGNTALDAGQFAEFQLSNISRVNLSGNQASFCLSSVDLHGAESFSYTGNGTLVLGFSHYVPVSGGAYDSPHTISAKSVTIADNCGSGWGGAIYNSGSSNQMLAFEGCGEVSIHGNSVTMDEEGHLAGAFIYSSKEYSTLVFRDNDKMIIRGNYNTDGETAQLGAVCIAGNLVLQVKDGQTFEVYDGMSIGGTIDINAAAQDGSARSGSVTFSGAHAEADLEALGFAATAEELASSRLVEAAEVQVHGGSLMLEQTTLRSKKGVTVEKGATLRMKNAELITTSGELTITSAAFEGCNTIQAPSVSAVGGVWTFNVGAANNRTAVLHLDFSGEGGSLTTQDQLLSVAYNSRLAPGKYKLVDFDSRRGSWVGAGSVTLSGVVSKDIDLPGGGDVYYTIKGDTYTLWFDYNGSLYQGEKPSPRPATALRWVAASGVWQEAHGADAWSGVVEDLNFYKGDLAVFRTAAEVTVAGVVRPEDVLVNLDSGRVVIDSQDGGQISGSCAITKMGAGELVLNLANAFTGYEEGGRNVGVILKEGALTVGEAKALGLDAATLVQGGTLNLGGLAVQNAIVISATEATLDGASGYAGKLTLESGDVAAGEDDVLHLATDAELMSGSLAHRLIGAGAVVKTGPGTVTLTGKQLEHTGGIVVEGGTLALQGVRYAGDSVVNVGTLSLNSANYIGKLEVGSGASLLVGRSILHGHVIVQKNATMQVDGFSLNEGDTLTLGGKVNGDVNLSGGTMVLTDAPTIRGTVEFIGGTVEIGGMLTVEGELKVKELTTLRTDVQTLADQMFANNQHTGSMSVIEAITLDEAAKTLLSMPELEGSRWELNVRPIAHTVWMQVALDMNSALLTWVPGDGQAWALNNSTEWLTSDPDKRFHNLDHTVFEDAGEVTIVGEVNPARINVQGDGNTSFIGSGSITGKSSLIKIGSGTLDIATDNKDYKGSVQVGGGELLLSHDNALGNGGAVVYNGATVSIRQGKRINSRIILMDGATIHDAEGGAASVRMGNTAHATVGGSYTLASGNSLSICPAGASFSGSFTFAGGTLNLESADGPLNLSAAKVSFASGSLTTIDVSGWTGLELGQSYTLITLAPASDLASFFTLTGASGCISYDEKTESLVMTLEETADTPDAGETPGGDGDTDPVLPEEPPAQRVPELSNNQNAALGAIESAVQNGQLSGELAELVEQALGMMETDPAAAAALLDKLSGAELATAMTSQIVGNLAHLRRLRANMGSGDSVDSLGKHSLYLAAFDEQHSVDANADGRGIKRTEWGGMLGYERRLNEKAFLGVAITSGSADVDPTNAESYSEDAVRLDLYYVVNFGRSWQSITSLGYGWHSYDFTRHISGYAAKASMDGASINFLQEFSYTIHTSANNSWQPFASLELTTNNIDSFAETGAGTASLEGSSRSATAADITLGTRFIRTFAMGSGLGSVQAQAGLVLAVGDTAANLDLRFSGARAQGFTVGAASYDGVGFNLGGGVELPVSQRASITGSLNAVLRSGAKEYGATLGVRIRF